MRIRTFGTAQVEIVCSVYSARSVVNDYKIVMRLLDYPPASPERVNNMIITLYYIYVLLGEKDEEW